MERFDWTKAIQTNIFLLKIQGLWPEGDGTYQSNVYRLYAIIAILMQTGHVIFQTINLFLTLNDLEATTGIIFMLIEEIMVILKMYCLLKNMKMLKQLLITLNDDLFQPKNLQQRGLVQPSLNAWTTIISAVRLFATGWLVSWCSFPFLDNTYREHRLPFLAWYPYNSKVSPFYELTYCYQVIAITYLCMANVNIDTLIAALNMYIGAQFDILCDDLRNFHEISENASGTTNAKLKKCIHHHREILKFAEQTNEFYNWLLFIQFVVCGISIGLAIFHLTLSTPFTSKFYSLISYSGGITGEVFLYCWFGNEIQIKSGQLSYALFESDWISLSPEVRKNLIIFMLKVQKSLNISALGLFNLSLDTFMKIMRTAWSYFALLRQVNSPAL
ncbi:7tm 6 domain containing protein [Asbolus verrucosus]|uniref:Odorant receptor n=1 Tax=Asbolus verrucosus TaxID=1661398 RepID=A0A482VDS6_ASBVE|nr:7tm 6 domain containing protein [Asbolus verrucosus]